MTVHTCSPKEFRGGLGGIRSQVHSPVYSEFEASLGYMGACLKKMVSEEVGTCLRIIL